jgi:hypothetical protein
MLAITIYKNRTDVMEAAEAFGPYATGFLGITKILTFYLRMDQFYDLIRKLNKLSDEGLMS